MNAPCLWKRMLANFGSVPGKFDVCRDVIGGIRSLAERNSGNCGMEFGKLDVLGDEIRQIERLPGRNSGNSTFRGVQFGKLDV